LLGLTDEQADEILGWLRDEAAFAAGVATGPPDEAAAIEDEMGAA